MTGRASIIVLGAGGHGKVVADVARCAGREVKAFVDDRADLDGTAIWGIPVMSWDRFLASRAALGPLDGALGVGDNAAREQCAARLERVGLALATLVHPAAVLSEHARLGDGSVVMAGAVVNPDATIGPGCIVNTGAVVEHDCVLASFVHISPGAALGGAVRVGRLSQVGLGAAVLPGVVIGAGVRVGAGAVVHRNVADDLTIVGVPGRPLPSRERGSGQ